MDFDGEQLETGEDKVRESFTHAEEAESQWPDPKTIENKPLSVPPFDPLLLPEALRPWVADIAERSQCPPDFLAVGAIVECAALIARRFAIRPKERDDWTVIPNLWGGVISPPGFLKSPALTETLKPLQHLAHEASLRFQQEIKEYDADRSVEKARREFIEKAMHAALKEKDPEKRDSNLKKLRDDLAKLASSSPHEARLLVNDTTVEKLGELLNENPGGLLIFRDELAGFLRSLERQGHESDRSFYCEAWNGKGRYTYDRIGRGTIHIERTCVSILGGTQPGSWRSYLREAFQDGRDDGFISRFQLMVWPDVLGNWVNVDRSPDTEAKDIAWQIFSKLENLDVSTFKAEQQEGGDLAFLHFNAAAQSLFNEWRTDLEAKLRRDDEHPILVSHLAKYRKLMPALALILYVIDAVGGFEGFEGRVPLSAAARAAAWCEFLEAHARRCYQSVTDESNTAAVALAAKIRSRRLTNPFRAREVHQCGWAGLSERDDVEKAIDELEVAHWLRREILKTDPEQGGRPSIQFWINPKVLEQGK